MHALAPASHAWGPSVTVDQDGAIGAVFRAIESTPEQGAGEQAKRMGLCPSGLVKQEALSLLAAVDAPERFSAAPFAGSGAFEQPAWILHATKIVGERRRLAAERQHREIRQKLGG